MRTLLPVAAVAALSLSVLPEAASAQVQPAVAAGPVALHLDRGLYAPGDPAPLVQAQYYWGGRRYCWYGHGWRGPGWYWCGYGARIGFGWGGPVGWRGWGGHGYGGGYRGGYHGGYHGGYRAGGARGGFGGGHGGGHFAGHGGGHAGGGGHGGGGHGGGGGHHH